MSAGNSPPSLGRYLQDIGLCTWTLLSLICLPYLVLSLLKNYDLSTEFILCPEWVYRGHYEVYRVATAAFMHGSVQHLGMNALALLTLGHGLEKQLGTAAFAALTVVTVVLDGALYVLLDWAYKKLPLVGSEMVCVVGFSGVLFTYLTLLCAFGPAQRRLFCLPGIKSRLIPWVFLLFSQLVAPNVSFLGHFTGIIVGILLENRLLGILLPSYAWLEASSDWAVIRWLEAKAKWIPVSPKSAIHSILSCCHNASSLHEIPISGSANSTELV
jgi:rhomboid domain-containing protein 1